MRFFDKGFLPSCLTRKMFDYTFVAHRASVISLRSMCTKHPEKFLPKNLNVARLVGSISTDVFITPLSKTRVFYLRTYNQDDFYDTHKVVVPSYISDSLLGIPKTGQKLLITGRLRVNQFTQDTGKKGTSIQIMAKQIYLCGGSGNGTMKVDSLNDDLPEIKYELNSSNTARPTFEVTDQNKVGLFAQICFDIHNEDTFSSLTLSYHYLTTNSDGTKEERTDFIPVFVYNETLRNTVRNQLKRLDRVRIDGILKYKPCLDENGKKQYKGYILANRIAKLINLRDIPFENQKRNISDNSV